MNKHRRLKSCVRLILLVAVSSLLTVNDFAQGDAPQGPVQNDVPKSKQSLEIKLRSRTPVACLGSFITLEVEITNNGNEDIELNRRYFWNSYSFCPINSHEIVQGKECFYYHFTPSSTNEDIFYLASGKTHVESRDWSLVDMEAGTHIFDARIYGTKNQLQIQVYECGIKPTKEQ